ncbi:MAG TPA: DinB family protein [Candidatus Aquilonibacter sp.]|jgi:uncharacterized damage-inducible protein DinB|nr:DinB family protein [Candidatus Aquilonibacter sp.]
MSARALIELLHGKGAHADPVACVEDVSAELAARQVNGFPHSIGQLVFHMNYWMEYDLRRIRGERPPYPQHNSESFPPTPLVNSEEWDRLKKRLALLIADFATMAELPHVELDRQIESTQPGQAKIAGTLEAVLWQLAVHNSYHTGQIAMIRRVLSAWPPRGGGDTW